MNLEANRTMVQNVLRALARGNFELRDIDAASTIAELKYNPQGIVIEQGTGYVMALRIYREGRTYRVNLTSHQPTVEEVDGKFLTGGVAARKVLQELLNTMDTLAAMEAPDGPL